MTWLRHGGRHVQGTVQAYLRECLVELGWANDDPADTSTDSLPFGPEQASLVRIRNTPAVTTDGSLSENVTAGVLSITVGDENESLMEELGGPLASQEYPLFFDVFQDTYGTALALATDVKDILMGRLPDTVRSMPVRNMANGAVVSGWMIELDDVIRVQPEHKFPLHWQVVKATATVYFPEVRY